MPHSQSHSIALQLAVNAVAALEAGDGARAAELGGEAAAAFVSEQGPLSFDAANMLRLRAQAQIVLADHVAAAATLDRADEIAAPLPNGEPSDRLRAQLGRQRGQVLLAAGDRPGARAALEAALEACEATLGEEDLDAAALHNLLGIVGKFVGTFDEAAAHYERAGEIYHAAGVEDSVLASLHHNLGGLAHSRGDLVTAERETRRALAMRAAAEGEAHPSTAADRGQLGAILSELGRHEEAERELRRTEQDMAAAHGAEHLEVAIARTTLGAALHRSGRLDDADACYRSGLALRERLQGAGHPELAPTLLNLSQLCEERADRTQAIALARRAAANLAGAVTDDHGILRAARERLTELQAGPA